MAELPVSTGANELTYIDYAKASALLGLSSGEHVASVPPTPTAEGGLGLWVGLPPLLRHESEDEPEFGFTHRDVSAVAIAHYEAANEFHVLVGPEGWSGARVPIDGTGLGTYGTGEDARISLADATEARQLGQPLRVAERDGVLGSSISTDLVAGWADRSVEVYADRPFFAALAEEFSDAFMVQFFDADFGSEPDAIITEPFQSVGIGSSIVDGRARQTIVYRFVSDEAASQAAPSVLEVWSTSALQSGEPISDYLTVIEARERNEMVIVETEVVADQLGIGVQVFLRGDPPGIHR